MTAFKYLAFISYSHADERRAATLHRAIERFAIPKSIRQQKGMTTARPRLFRDKDELAASSDLGATLKQHIADSAALIVLCSRSSAKSRWVDSEVAYFREVRGDGRIFCVQLDGDDDPRPLPPSLLAGSDPARPAPEPYVLDWREGGESIREIVMRLVAGMLEVDFDQLKRRAAARRRLIALAWCAASVPLIGAGVLGVRQYASVRQSALRAQSLKLAQFAIEQTDAGDAALGAKLALMALPKDPANPERPFVPEADRALLHALAEWRDIRTDARLPSSVTAVVDAPRTGTLYLGLLDGGLYVLKPEAREPERLAALPSRITAVGLDSQEKYLVATGAPSTIAVWDAASGRERYRAEFPELADSGFHQWSVDPEGKRLAFHAVDIGRGVFVIDLDRGEKTFLAHESGGFPVCAAWDARGRLFTAWVGDKNELRVFEAPAFDHPKRYALDFSPRGCAQSRPGDRVVVYGEEGRLSEYRAAEQYRLEHRWQGVSRDATVVAAAYDPSNGYLAAAGSDRRLTVWALGASNVAATTALPTAAAELSIDTTGKHVLVQDTDGKVRLGDLNESSGAFVPLPTAAGAAAVFTGTSQIAFPYGERGVRIQSVESRVTRLAAHRGAIRGVSFSPSGKTILTASDDETALLLDAATGQQRMPALALGAWILHSETSADSTRILACGTGGKTRVWAASDGTALTPPEDLASAGNAEACHFDPTASRVLIADTQGRARLWDLTTRRCIVSFEAAPKAPDRDCHRQPSTGDDPPHVAAIFSTDGRFVIAAFGNGVIRSYDATTFAIVGEHTGGSYVETLRRCGKDARFVTAGLDGSAIVWPDERLRDGRTMKLGSSVRYADFSADCSQLLIVSDDEGATLWDVDRRVQKRALGGVREIYQAGQFSPDGRSVLLYHTNGTAQYGLLVDTADGRILKRLGGHPGIIWAGAISPDGRQVVTGDAAGQIAIWQLDYDTAEMRDRVRRSVSDLPLSPEQRERFLIDDRD
jgi:WD40 repeat protein